VLSGFAGDVEAGFESLVCIVPLVFLTSIIPSVGCAIVVVLFWSAPFVDGVMFLTSVVPSVGGAIVVGVATAIVVAATGGVTTGGVVTVGVEAAGVVTAGVTIAGVLLFAMEVSTVFIGAKVLLSELRMSSAFLARAAATLLMGAVSAFITNVVSDFITIVLPAFIERPVSAFTAKDVSDFGAGLVCAFSANWQMRSEKQIIPAFNVKRLFIIIKFLYYDY
jgi:hypothetical protein